MRFQDSFDLLSGFRIRIAVFDSGQFGLRAYRPQMEAPAAIRFTAISPLDVRVHVTATENLRQNPRCSGAAWAAGSKFVLQ
jgi:hypothetical protein